MSKKRDARDSPCQRRWTRIKTTGIVALTSGEMPLVSLIYDIAEGGVSFIHAAESDTMDGQFRMDILIFDNMMNFEYYISHVRGEVQWRQQIVDPHNNIPVWRYHVQFIDLHPQKAQLLQIFCDSAGSSPTFFL